MADSDAEYPLAAQIPLPSFQLPTFPPEASHLRSLTLTADIKLDEYQALVQDLPSREETFNIPSSHLPQSITHLTLELFTLGFPAGYLSSLASSLPNLKSLTLFSCLIDGITDASRADAEAFFETTPLLAELHVLDTFARVGFWETAGRIIQQRAEESRDVAPDAGLKVLEVSYTYRGFNDEDFLARVGGEEWAQFVTDGAVGLAFGLVPDAASTGEETAQEQSTNGGEAKAQNEGIRPFSVSSRASEGLRKRFKGAKQGSRGKLKMLDLSLWALRSSDVADILNSCIGKAGSDEGIADLTLSILMEEGWLDRLAEALSLTGKTIEGLEIIGVPSEIEEMGGAVQNRGSLGHQHVALMGQKDLEALSAVCPGLRRLSMSILRTKGYGRVAWAKVEEGSWEERRA
jgi:hypothetical protein